MSSSPRGSPIPYSTIRGAPNAIVAQPITKATHKKGMIFLMLRPPGCLFENMTSIESLSRRFPDTRSCTHSAFTIPYDISRLSEVPKSKKKTLHIESFEPICSRMGILSILDGYHMYQETCREGASFLKHNNLLSALTKPYVAIQGSSRVSVPFLHQSALPTWEGEGGKGWRFMKRRALFWSSSSFFC